VRYLQILNAVLLALGSVMGLILAVVCLLYGVHVAGEPRVAGAGGLALLAHRREWMLRWPLQALPLAPLAGILMFVLSLR
jgi:hypothetical protein